jgi:hypothetical protein
MHKMAAAVSIFGVPAMNEEPTTIIIQRYPDILPADTAAEARLLLADLRPPTPPGDTPST